MISHYPHDCGSEKFRQLFNCIIEPRHPVRPVDDDLNILCCYYGKVEAGETLNDFVPLTLSNNKKKFPQASTSSKMSRQNITLCGPGISPVGKSHGAIMN